MPQLRRRYHLGAVDSRGRDELVQGEMQVATGIHYKPGDKTRAHKNDGRSTFGDTSAAARVDGLELLKFDSGGNDTLAALSNSVVYGATPGATGMFSTLYTPTTSPTSMDAAHANNRHYVVLGTENFVLKSDGTTRGMGMQSPGESFVSLTPVADGVVYSPTASQGDFDSPEKAYDADEGTAALSLLNAPAQSETETWTFDSEAGADDRKVIVLWSLGSGGQADPKTGDIGASVTVRIELSQNSGVSFTDIVNFTTDQPIDKLSNTFVIGADVDLADVYVRATFSYVSGIKSIPFKIWEIKVLEGGSGETNFAVNGLLYAFTEYDADEGIESIPSDPELVTFAAHNSVKLVLPATPVNSNATDWRIYRTADNGTASQLGLLGTIPIAQTVYVDDFLPTSERGPDVQLNKLIAMVHVTANTPERGIESFYRDYAPPNMRKIEYFEGSLVGLSNVDKRSMNYSVAGFPDSWPQINNISAFPLPENDELVDLISIGQSIIFGAKEAMLRMDELPRSVGGTFIASTAEQIKGAPGVVGKYAMTALNFRGISNCAWISPENGVLVTDGDKWDTIADDVDWSQFDGFDKSNWVLRWVRGLQAIVLAYSSTSGGVNDRYMILHIGKDHLKQGNQAKVTWPHYGAISSMVSGQVSDTFRIYEGHYSDGKVYLNLDSSTGADSSKALDGAATTNRLQIKGSRNYEEPRAYQLVDGNLHHTDFGDGQECTVTIEVGRDQSGASETVSKTVALNGHKGTRFHVGRAGEWAEETITHDGTGRGAIRDIRFRANAMGDEGEFSVTN